MCACLRNGWFRSRADARARRRRRSRTSMPSSRRMPRPRPDAFSVGSSEATTTRLMPAATIASVQGGVWPWWQQGSSVTYMRRADRVDAAGARAPRPRRAPRRRRRDSPRRAPRRRARRPRRRAGSGSCGRAQLGELDRPSHVPQVLLCQVFPPVRPAERKPCVLRRGADRSGEGQPQPDSTAALPATRADSARRPRSSDRPRPAGSRPAGHDNDRLACP